MVDIGRRQETEITGVENLRRLQTARTYFINMWSRDLRARLRVDLNRLAVLRSDRFTDYYHIPSIVTS